MRIPILILALALSSPAQEANPFVKKPREAPVPEPSGPGFVGVLEHVLVAPEVIDTWLEEHGMPDDASKLRDDLAEAAKDGRASVDHTAVLLGVVGGEVSVDSILEQIYPTEYFSNGPGVWPAPTSFETRNLGYATQLRTGREDGAVRFKADGEFAEMRPHHAWHPLAEKTRQPGDVFLPVIRSVRIPNPVGGRGADPFAADSRPLPDDWAGRALELGEGKTHWLGRMDPLPADRDSGGRSRLIFFRGMEVPAPAAGETPERFRFSFSAVKVRHGDFSDWLRGTSLAEVPSEAWEKVGHWKKAGTAEVVDAGGRIADRGGECLIESVREVSYPTEWLPTNQTVVLERWTEDETRRQGGEVRSGRASYARKRVDAVAGIAGASLPTSFETRNEGLTVEASFSGDGKGVVAKLRIGRVRQVGLSTYRRIEVDGEWIPDIQLPLFASSHYEGTCRLSPGSWTLLGSGVEHLADGGVDRDHCVLYFVRIE